MQAPAELLEEEKCASSRATNDGTSPARCSQLAIRLILPDQRGTFRFHWYRATIPSVSHRSYKPASSGEQPNEPSRPTSHTPTRLNLLLLRSWLDSIDMYTFQRREMQRDESPACTRLEPTDSGERIAQLNSNTGIRCGSNVETKCILPYLDVAEGLWI